MVTGISAFVNRKTNFIFIFLMLYVYITQYITFSFSCNAVLRNLNFTMSKKSPQVHLHAPAGISEHYEIQASLRATVFRAASAMACASMPNLQLR